MALISFFMVSSEMRAGSKSTRAVRPGRLTEALAMPSSSLSLRSTLAEQAEQAMPMTGMVCFISNQIFSSPLSLRKGKPGNYKLSSYRPLAATLSFIRAGLTCPSS